MKKMQFSNYKKIILIIMILSSFKGLSQSNSTPDTLSYYDLPIHIDAPINPQVVKGSDNKWYTAYNLFIYNRSHSDFTLKQVNVFNKNGDVLLSFDRTDLEDYYKFRANLAPNEEDKSRTIKAGHTGVLFFWIVSNDKKLISDTLRHKFIFDHNPFIEIWGQPYPIGEDIILDNYLIDVKQKPSVVFGSPLKGNRWKVGNGPGEYKSGHQYLVTSNSYTRNPQRYGIDFQIIDEKNITLPIPLPDVLTNEMFYCYGQEIFAVADGVVTGFKDGISENIPQASGETITDYKMDATTVYGNFLTIKIGEKQFVNYAHLIPGSLRFKLGDKIKKGQIIGLLGNSGNSTAPHLHFNFTDGINANASEGLPYVFESFQTTNDGKMHKNEIPLFKSIINFNK